MAGAVNTGEVVSEAEVVCDAEVVSVLEAESLDYDNDEIARAVAMVEGAPINMMFADRTFTITYINPASVKKR